MAAWVSQQQVRTQRKCEPRSGLNPSLVFVSWDWQTRCCSLPTSSPQSPQAAVWPHLASHVPLSPGGEELPGSLLMPALAFPCPLSTLLRSPSAQLWKNHKLWKFGFRNKSVVTRVTLCFSPQELGTMLSH